MLKYITFTGQIIYNTFQNKRQKDCTDYIDSIEVLVEIHILKRTHSGQLFNQLYLRTDLIIYIIIYSPCHMQTQAPLTQVPATP